MMAAGAGSAESAWDGLAESAGDGLGSAPVVLRPLARLGAREGFRIQAVAGARGGTAPAGLGRNEAAELGAGFRNSACLGGRWGEAAGNS